MPRALTSDERAVLAHIVTDPDAWWSHANDVDKIDAEAALVAKIDRWRGDYEAATEAKGNAYQTRAQRDAEEV